MINSNLAEIILNTRGSSGVAIEEKLLEAAKRGDISGLGESSPDKRTTESSGVLDDVTKGFSEKDLINERARYLMFKRRKDFLLARKKQHERQLFTSFAHRMPTAAGGGRSQENAFSLAVEKMLEHRGKSTGVA